ERIAQVEQNAAVGADVNGANRRRHLVDAAVDHLGARAADAVGEPERVVESAQGSQFLLDVFRGVGQARPGDEVPALARCQVEGDHLGPLPLHVETEVPAGSPERQDALATEVDPTEVLAPAAAQIPAPLHRAVPGQIHRVVEPALIGSGHLPRGGVDSIRHELPLLGTSRSAPHAASGLGDADSHFVSAAFSAGCETSRCQMTPWNASACGVTVAAFTVGTMTQASATCAVEPPLPPTV